MCNLETRGRECTNLRLVVKLFEFRDLLNKASEFYYIWCNLQTFVILVTRYFLTVKNNLGLVRAVYILAKVGMQMTFYYTFDETDT